MIKDIEMIYQHDAKYIKEFVRNCRIEEKIDAHYVTVEILSADKIRLVKGNGFEIDRVDHILNNMWNQLLIDWQYLMLCNQQWFANHVGHSIRMFYLPNSKPIETEYPEGLRYILDVVEHDGARTPAQTALAELRFPDLYKVDYKRSLSKVDDVEAVADLVDVRKPDEAFYDKVFSKLVKDRGEMFAVGEPEGVIYKSGTSLYQHKTRVREGVVTEKTSYEFLLCHFARFLKANSYVEKMSNSYVKTVCNLFNWFIIDEQKSGYLARNIDAQSLEAPCIGRKYDMGYEYIPDPVTKQLCAGNELYRNIFKILLANLRKKKNPRNCLFMNRQQADSWNTIVSMIQAHSVFV